MNKMLTKQLLLSSNYWVLNKDVVNIFGLEAAFLLSNFAEAETMMADKEGWFYQTSDTVEKMTTLSRHKQDQCIKQLETMGVLEKDLRGMPAKRYFRIEYSSLTNLIVKNQQTRLSNIDKQVCKKSATNKESSYKENSYKESTERYSASDDTPHTYIKDTNEALKEAYKEYKSRELKEKKKNEKLVIESNFERVWALYPNKKGKGKISDTKKKEVYRFGDEFDRCIKRYIKYVSYKKSTDFKELQYQIGSTFFNSGYVDYLDKNYIEGSELDGPNNGNYSKSKRENGEIQEDTAKRAGVTSF